MRLPKGCGSLSDENTYIGRNFVSKHHIQPDFGE